MASKPNTARQHKHFAVLIDASTGADDYFVKNQNKASDIKPTYSGLKAIA